MIKGFSAISFLIVIAMLAIIGGGIYYLKIESAASIVSNPTNTQEVAGEDTLVTSSTGEFRSSLPRLVARGDALECDWRLQVEDSTSQARAGKLWTMGNQGRSSGTGSVNGVAMEANTIYKDEVAYTWVEPSGNNVGFTFAQSLLEETDNAMNPEQKQQAEQISQEMIFDCKSWVPDLSKFEVPSDVQFRTI